MGLSYDLISEFVKITNDKKEGAKEGTVYATVVNSTEGKYVKIDGSDLLTPIDTTTGIDDGERVTVMIKDHKATVTGNITSPSVGTNKFDSLVGTIVDANLEGINADIENLIAKNAYLENVFAQNSILIDSKIENLVARDSYLENTYAENATIIDSKIENLEATDSRIENSVIENFQVIDGVVQDLKATNADIKILNADFAQIKTLVNGNLTSDNILSFNLTSEKVTVDDAFIKDAMIDTISAGKINAGKINTNSVSIGSEDGGMLITGSTQQFMDKNGNVRIQIGKDASGDFTFILYGEDGTGQLINQNGITASAIGDGLIVNDMVSDNAAISGGKLDISSVITEINSDNSTTIKSSKIYLNDQAQSLEVAFNSLKTKVDTIQEVTIQGDLTAIVEQVQSNTSKIEVNRDNISTLISENSVVKKQVTDLQGTLSETETTLNSKYTSLSQSLDGFKTTVTNTYATKKSVTDVVDNIEANYSTTSAMNSAIEQKAQEISASVSETYATKTQVNTLDNNLKSNYSTTKQMESAISIAKEEINLGVSELYETKSEVTNKINGLSISSVNRVLGSEVSKSRTFAGEDNESWVAYNISGDIRNKNVVIAFDYVATDIVKQSSHAIKFQACSTESSGSALYYPAFKFDLADGNSSGTIISSPVMFGDIKAGTNAEFRFRFDKVSGTFEISKARVFIGTKDLGWSPAPEDIDNNIDLAKTEAISSANDTLTSTISNYYTKTQTDSQINIAKEAIDLSVSNTYETKTSIASKVDSTLKSAKSYADTKKTEAISAASDDATSKANTAKQEAIKSADKTLTSTIANYYTKTQTDSQINIAKEAIDLSVSNTYETKTSVASKVDSTLKSAKSYTDDKKSEAISAASEDATSKVNNLKVSGVNRVFKSSIPADVFTLTNSANQSYQPYDISGDIRNQNITIAFDYIATDIIKNDEYRVMFQSTYTKPDNTIFHGPTQKFEIPEGNSSGTIVVQPLWFGDIKEETNAKFRFRFDNVSGTFQISKARAFIGTKDLGWSPAPEDIESDMSIIKSETKSIKESVSSLTLGADSISASVKSLEESVTNTTNGLSSDISRIQDQVNLAMTSDNVKLEIQKEMSKGVNKVSTSTGFTFDDKGLMINKSDSEMNTQITEDGMKIYKNNEVMLTANNQGVDAKNLHATTYLIIGGNSRMEDFIENGSKRTAIFWIGQS